MSREPLIEGAWLTPGQHLDLIGAYRPDMREADDDAIRRARVFVDSYDTTVGHIGEIKIPLENFSDQKKDYTLKVAFTDYLSGKVLSDQKVITVQ